MVTLKGGSAAAESVPQVTGPPYQNTFFDPDPHHPWNRLYGMLFIRPGWDGKLYGLDELDPLYWPDTHYLLDQPFHQKVLRALDDFIQSRSARLVSAPLQRALLQRMLWALFDSLALHQSDSGQKDFAPERREIEVRLVKIMKSVALTGDGIKALPDNYKLQVASKSYPAAFDPAHPEQPFLPGTFFSHSGWVDLADGLSAAPPPIAPVHVAGVSGRSAFHVLISLPAPRADTLAYLKKLDDFAPHWIYDRNIATTGLSVNPTINPDLPQVPPLTTFALVRMANLIDANGEPVNSPLMESIQLRLIRTLSGGDLGSAQFPFLFILDQSKLMKGQGGLIAQQKRNKGFEMVLSQLMMISGDSLERRYGDNGSPEGETSLNTCFQCHSEPGIFSMNSYNQSLFQDKRTLWPPDLEEAVNPGLDSVNWKQQQYDWGLLQAYWFQ